MAETLKANPYVYAANNPVNAIDPSGKAAFPGSFHGLQWVLYENGEFIRLWVNDPLAQIFGGAGAIRLGGFELLWEVPWAGEGIGGIILGAIGGIVGGVIGASVGWYDLVCGGKGAYINFLPQPSLSLAC